MPKVKLVTVYMFSELDEQAKERARAWYRDCADAAGSDFAEYVIEDFENICAILGVDLSQKQVRLYGGGTRNTPEVYWSGFYRQGDGASFDGRYSYGREATKSIKKYAPEDRKLHRIAEELQEIQRVNFYQLTASISTSGRGCASYNMSIRVERDDDKEPTEGADEVVTDALRSLADWLYSMLRSEYEYQNSDEVVDESIEANEYTFDEDGNRE